MKQRDPNFISVITKNIPFISSYKICGKILIKKK